MDLIVLALMTVVMSSIAFLGANGKLPRRWAIVLGALAFSTFPFDITMGPAYAHGMSIFSLWAEIGATKLLEVLCIIVPFSLLASWACMNLATLYVVGRQHKRKNG